MKCSKLKKSLLLLIMGKLDVVTVEEKSLDSILSGVSDDTRRVLNTLSSEDLKSLRKDMYNSLTIGGL